MSNMKTTYLVTYKDWANETAQQLIEVRQAYTCADEPAEYYGVNAKLGCGKNAPHAEAAARRLVQDHSEWIISAIEVKGN